MAKNPLSKVLIVDDDEDTLVIAKYALQPLKEVECRTVTSGQAALQEAKSFLPDLIFLDVMMPEMDGVATFKAIRETKEIAHIPVVFFTAKVQKEEIDSYIKLGGVDVITKPFDPISLPNKVQEIWGKCP